MYTQLLGFFYTLKQGSRTHMQYLLYFKLSLPIIIFQTPGDIFTSLDLSHQQYK